MKDTIDEIQKEVGNRLYETCLRGIVPDGNDLLSKNDIVKLKRCIFAQAHANLPPITTHNIQVSRITEPFDFESVMSLKLSHLQDDPADPVMNAFRRCQLFNKREDRVKVIFHPEFLSSTNPLFGLDYQEFVRGT